jgi:WD40 repeat protein
VLFPLASPDDSETLRGHERPVNEVLFSPDGSRVISGSFDGTVRIWNVSGKPPRLVDVARHAGDIDDICVSNDGTLPGERQPRHDRGDLGSRDGAPVQRLTGHEAAVTSVALDPRGAWLASASEDGKVFLWWELRQAGAPSRKYRVPR